MKIDRLHHNPARPPKQGGTVSAHISLNGSQYKFFLRITGTDFKALRELDDEDRKFYLDSLASYVIRGPEKKRIQRGHSPTIRKAWTTARVLAPLYVEWAEKAPPPEKKKVTERMRQEGLPGSSGSHAIAAFLVELNWRNAYSPDRSWTEPFKKWPGKRPPSADPKAFFNTFRKGDPRNVWTVKVSSDEETRHIGQFDAKQEAVQLTKDKRFMEMYDRWDVRVCKRAPATIHCLPVFYSSISNAKRKRPFTAQQLRDKYLSRLVEDTLKGHDPIILSPVP